jgi:hypothetical protein
MPEVFSERNRTEAELRESKMGVWMFSAQAAGAFVIITQLATKDALSKHQQIAVCMFAAALPLLIGGALGHFEGYELPRPWRALITVAGAVGSGLFVVGMFELLLAFGWRAAVAYLAAGIWMVVLFQFGRQPIGNRKDGPATPSGNRLAQ